MIRTILRATIISQAQTLLWQSFPLHGNQPLTQSGTFWALWDILGPMKKKYKYKNRKDDQDPHARVHRAVCLCGRLCRDPLSPPQMHHLPFCTLCKVHILRCTKHTSNAPPTILHTVQASASCASKCIVCNANI